MKKRRGVWHFIQNLGLSQKINGRNAKWYDTNAAEMRAYIGFHIIISIIGAPSQDLYLQKTNCSDQQPFMRE